MDIVKLIGGIVFRSVGKTGKAKEKLKKTDLGILKVALMVAALDGDVLPSEYEAFRVLATKGFGYTDEVAARALKDAMRSAGYLMLVAGRATNEELVREFISEANAVLPSGFAYLSVEDVRQAILTWIVMAMSDNDYSARERLCIEALRLRFAELKATRIERENEYWRSLPANVRCVVEEYPGSRIKLASKDFVGKVETIVAQFGGSVEARRKLASLVANGE